MLEQECKEGEAARRRLDFLDKFYFQDEKGKEITDGSNIYKCKRQLTGKYENIYISQQMENKKASDIKLDSYPGYPFNTTCGNN